MRGAFVVRELTHDDGPDGCVCDLEWGRGCSAQHLESDEVGLSKAHAAALRNLLYPHDGGAVCEAVRAMLARFVDDLELLYSIKIKKLMMKSLLWEKNLKSQIKSLREL